MTAMNAFAPRGWTPSNAEFRPVASYFPEMDYVLYLREDCAFREDRIDRILTLLWHPYERRAVGVHLKGFRAFYELIRANISPNMKEEFEHKVPFLSLVSLLEFCLRSGDGDALVKDAESKRRAERRREAYEQAIELLGDTTLPVGEVKRLEMAA